MAELLYEEIHDFPDEKVLGFVPIWGENMLPSCMLLTERDVVNLSPKK